MKEKYLILHGQDLRTILNNDQINVLRVETYEDMCLSEGVRVLKSILFV